MEEKNTVSKVTQIKSLRLLANVEGLPLRHKDCGFNNFEVNGGNKNVLDVCKGWTGEDSITLTGSTGVGKTHLAVAMLRNFPMQEEISTTMQDMEERRLKHILEKADKESEEYKIGSAALEQGMYKYRRAQCLFIPMVELFIKLNEEAMDQGKLKSLERFSDQTYDCICFDDLGAERLTDAKRENLYFIIDRRYRNVLPTIITSNFTIKEINESEPRIASRLSEMGRILQLNGSDYRLK